MQSDPPLVSILMNCYNGEKYLRAALDSVLAQTYRNWELIFWDNRSTDRSADILQSYNEPRLKYFYAPKHTRLYEARNHALAQSQGEYVAFLDVDDWWCIDKLEMQVPLFDDTQVGIVCGNFVFANEITKTRFKRNKATVPMGWVVNDLLTN